MLLTPGDTCWRTARAGRLTVLMDSASYFAAIKSAMAKARRSIHLLGWAFDPATRLTPDRDGDGVAAGPFLRDLALARPELDVRVLIWKSALPIAASQHFFPHRARRCFEGSPVRFRLDASVPLGACHHQKVLVIDDALAFCGGGDIGVDRWDSQAHRDYEPRRTMPWGERHGPRHEVMAMVDGPAAAMLGDLVRRRWAREGGRLPPPLPPPAELVGAAEDLWPGFAQPEFRDVDVSLARTEPDWRDFPEVSEVERLHMAAIAAARRSIYLENQYVTSPLLAEALARRLSEPDGPEVVIVSTAVAPSWFDRMTMDQTRSRVLERLRAADRHGRFRAFCPYTRQGRPIIVHSKVAIIDDRLLRIGSANLNNRSMGFDTECDLVVEAKDAVARAAVARVRARLIGHFLGRRAEEFERAYAGTDGIGRAIDVLDDAGGRRLMPLEPKPLGALARLIAAYHLGDPAEPGDSWRPWRRKADIEADRRRFLLDAGPAPEEG